jgi:hypothetical protein
LPVDRQQVRGANQTRHPIAPHVNRRHQVEPQQREVREIVSGEFLTREVSVNATQTAKAIRAHANAFEIGQYNAASIADNNVLDVTTSVHKHADLPVNLVRCFRKLTRELLRDDLARRNPPLIKLFEPVKLMRLEPL